MCRINLLLVLTAAVTLIASRGAAASTITIDAVGRGWFDQNGRENGTSPGNNYIAGNCGLDDCDDGEFRNWLQFAIPALPGRIGSAELILATDNVKFEQGPIMTLTVTSLPAVFGFSDLGTGAFYGSRDYSLADKNTTQSISLSAAALADIAASELGTFGTSARISAGASFGPDLENQFIFSGGSRSVTQLQITMIPDLTTVVFDIKPGSDPNSVNLGSNGVLPVAILSTEDFNVSDIDIDTLMFGDPLLLDIGGTAVGPLRYAFEDVSDDGLLDLTLKFSVSELVDNHALGSDSSEGVLTGELRDGTSIIGTDVVRIVPPRGNGRSNKAAGSMVIAVPEPSAAIFAILGALAVPASTRRRRR